MIIVMNTELRETFELPQENDTKREQIRLAADMANTLATVLAAYAGKTFKTHHARREYLHAIYDEAVALLDQNNKED